MSATPFKYHHSTAWALLTLLWVCAASAADWDDVEGSQDLAAFERFPDTAIVRFSEEDAAKYLLALGKVKKIDGNWQPERVNEITGRWTSVTYRARDRQTSAAVFEHFTAQFDALGYEPLYRCTGLACGSSNKWANDVFQEKLLYGPQIHQRYYSGQKDNTVVTLYVIKRGNKRIYARIDQIDSRPVEAAELPTGTTEASKPLASDGSAQSLMSELISNKRLVIPLEGNQWPESAINLLDSIAEWMTTVASAGQNLRLVAHRYTGENVEDQLRRSRRDAELVAQHLQQRGVPAERLQSYGVGPLAPGEGNAPSRVVLTLISGSVASDR